MAVPPNRFGSDGAEGISAMTHLSKIAPRRFAPASPVFTLRRLAALVLVCGGFCIACAVAAEAGDTRSNSNAKKQVATAQFARAEDQRAALNERPAARRTLAEYKQVVTSYRRVALITPHAPEVTESLVALGEIYTEMGDQYGRSYYQSAVDSYRFLLKDYPGSKHAQDALFRIAELQKDHLGDLAQATKSYEEFLKKYPRSPRRREAQEARAELALLQNHDASGATSAANAPPKSALRADEMADTRDTAANSAASTARKAQPSENARRVANDDSDNSPATPAKDTEISRIEDVSAAATPEYTRVTIQLEDRVEYSAARIGNPERIFFDLHTAKLTPEAAKKAIHVEGGLLTAVRVGQFHAGIVRVVLDVHGVKDYVASMAGSPPKLVIDLYPGAAPKAAKAAASEKEEAAAQSDQAARDEAEIRTRAATSNTVAVEKAVEKGAKSEPAGSAKSGRAGVADSATATITAAVLPSPVATLPSAKTTGKGPKGGRPDLIQPSTTAVPTRDGQSTLTRALGLKIGRIVIDAGHGGHDTGTIGPTGLMEKDLCLDVALRLGKIIQQRLPGADVVYTRSDDTFIPLEERTHIANEQKADLFISIHANSSHDHQARGIETYYLNLKGSPEAMEVAARENATANESVHDLEDLVKRIARSEKIDESREFAADVQESLSKRIQKNYKPVKDRGVRKAPFVVLIGADMPSVLTEISFLSNPADEQLLKKPDHRQRVAEGIYQGVASYLQSLNSMTVNLPKMPLKTPSRSMASAAVEESRNPQ
jgi:N-acetylmuramoyl-L-alanine amidase